jgi:hypothetical protein
MWFLSDVCRLFANNPGSLALNPGLGYRIFANNSGRKYGCLQFLWIMFAGRYTLSIRPEFSAVLAYNPNMGNLP